MRGADRVPLLLIGLVIGLALLAPAASAAYTTTTVDVVKVASDGSVLAKQTVDYRWLEAHLPVMGDGSTHYYHQGPTGDPTDPWDPTESKSWQDDDMGALKGTRVKDICGLVGGMSRGDTLEVVAADDYPSDPFSYETVYSPSARQGPMVLTWWRGEDGYVTAYRSGMKIVFFADTSTNSQHMHVFGVSDMKASMPESEWGSSYVKDVKYPSTTALAIRYVKELRIRSTQPPPTATPRPTTATPTPTVTTTQPTLSVQTTGTAPAVTTDATLAPAVPGSPTGAAPIGENATLTTAPTADMGPGGNVTIGPEANGTAAVTTLDPAANLTGNVTPFANSTTVPTALPLDTTFSYSATEPTTDIDEAGAENTTNAATVTPTATAPPAAPPAITARPSSPPAVNQSPAPVAVGSANRSISFTFSFEVKENGVGAAGTVPPSGASAAISPASPLGALWTFVRALVDLIDTFFT